MMISYEEIEIKNSLPCVLHYNHPELKQYILVETLHLLFQILKQLRRNDRQSRYEMKNQNI